MKPKNPQKEQNKRIDKMINILLLYRGYEKNKNLISAIKAFEIVLKNSGDLFFYIAGAKRNEYKKIYEYILLAKIRRKSSIFMICK